MDAKTTLYLIAAGVLALVFRRLVRKLVWRLVKLAGRFLAGHHLAGRRTDYGWWKPGDKDAPLARTVTRWGHASMATRAGVRLAVLAAGAGVAYGWHSHPGATLAAGLALAGGLALLECWHLVNLAKAWRHRRHVLHPMAAAIGPLLGVIPQTAHTLIHLPRTYGKVTDGEIGHVRLPDAFRASPDERKAVEHLVSSRLPVEIETRWLTAMTPMRLQINAAPKPPEMVRFSELRAEMDACQPGDIVIGLDRRRQVYRGSFRTADPHWGFSCASGRGKSAFLQMVCSQVLHQDSAATVTGVDPKMESLDPLIGVPGVRVANNPRDVPAMWQAIADFRAEMDRRMDQRAADPTAEFPLALLVVDEVNQFSAMTGAVWRELKERGQPAIAPVWMEVASILWQGRAFNCHLIMVGQRLDNHATGGIGLRDSLGLRGLAGFTPQQWMMLVGTTPVPRSQRPRGRWIYSDGQDHTWVQNLFLTEEEVRAYALEGRLSGVSLSLVPNPSHPAETVPTGTGTQPAESTPWIVGMAAGAAYVDLSEEAFKKRRQRAGGALPGEVRTGNQPAWKPADLDTWKASWPRVVSELAQ